MCENMSRSSNQEIDTRFSRDCKNTNLEEANHGRLRDPLCADNQSVLSQRSTRWTSRISGLPHAAVKQADHFRVRELVKKIENHPHRQDLQADPQQNNACNPFSEKSKKMIKEMGSVEVFELCETNPEPQCKECLLYWNQGIVYCTCGHLLKGSFKPSPNSKLRH